MICLYKITRMIRHNKHGWLKNGQLVACRPEYAKRFVTRNEMIRVTLQYDKNDIKKSLFIDDEQFRPQAKKNQAQVSVTIPDHQKKPNHQKKPQKRTYTKRDKSEK